MTWLNSRLHLSPIARSSGNSALLYAIKRKAVGCYGPTKTTLCMHTGILQSKIHPYIYIEYSPFHKRRMWSLLQSNKIRKGADEYFLCKYLADKLSKWNTHGTTTDLFTALKITRSLSYLLSNENLKLSKKRDIDKTRASKDADKYFLCNIQNDNYMKYTWIQNPLPAEMFKMYERKQIPKRCIFNIWNSNQRRMTRWS